jgi:hypothetical protein
MASSVKSASSAPGLPADVAVDGECLVLCCLCVSGLCVCAALGPAWASAAVSRARAAALRPLPVVQRRAAASKPCLQRVLLLLLPVLSCEPLLSRLPASGAGNLTPRGVCGRVAPAGGDDGISAARLQAARPGAAAGARAARGEGTQMQHQRGAGTECGTPPPRCPAAKLGKMRFVVLRSCWQVVVAARGSVTAPSAHDDQLPGVSCHHIPARPPPLAHRQRPPVLGAATDWDLRLTPAISSPCAASPCGHSHTARAREAAAAEATLLG